MGKIMDKIVILDMGGQYAHLLARRVRQLGIYSEILPNDTSAEKLENIEGIKGIIISGGPSSVYDKSSPKPGKGLFEIKVPILGLCYGHQLMAQNLGGKVSPGKTKEYGVANLQTKKTMKKIGDIFAGLNDNEKIWMSHGDSVEKLPKGFELIGSTEDCPIAAMGNKNLNYYGIQFHPEVTHTEHGMKIISNFVFEICKAEKSWSMDTFIDDKIKEIKSQTGKRNVFLLVSGGVDSSVCFALLNKALGSKRVYGLHIDNGFMRKNESREIEAALRKNGFSNFHAVDASSKFLEAVKGISDPEKKRKAIGGTFIKVQQDEVSKLNLNPNDWMLGQGTIYPDTIETKGTKNADLIKTHHNRVEAVQKLIEKGLVIEPIKELYKDEVRELGMKLGLPASLVNRHPFPGPGLAVRCLCIGDASQEKEKTGNDNLANNLAEAERQVSLICNKFGAKSKILPIKSVGVQGDSRTYRYPAAVWGINDYNLLEKLSTELTNKVKEINRVMLYVSGKAGKGMENTVISLIEKSFLTKERLDLLREADSAVHEHIKLHLYSKIWQFPVVLAPVSVSLLSAGREGNTGESIILRPVESREAMTANWARLPEADLNVIAKEIMKIKGISAVFYDVTNKPPATIEWE